MNIKVFDTSDEVNEAGAASIIQLIHSKPAAKLSLATGNSPIGIYGVLAEKYRKGSVSFSNVTTVNIDEYIGLSKMHVNSFFAFMNKHLYSKVDLHPDRIHIPDGIAENPDKECERYNRIIKQMGPIDLQLLGIGMNGHIGFNEPGDVLSPNTHVVRLTEETRRINSLSFPSLQDVPTHAITMGVADIMRARKIVFVAFGSEKAEIVHRALTGPVTTECPGSLLQLHPNVEVLLDGEAGKYF